MMRGDEPEPETAGQELRIACIDIGGGTTDLMIASYGFQPGIDDYIHGQVLHVDGIPVAVSGDQAWGLVLLQRSGQTLCESDARATYCRGGREIMGLSSAYLPLAAP